MSISKNQLKLIKSLQHKKYRQKHGLFVAEGQKVVNEFLASDFTLETLFCVTTFETTIASSKIQRVSQENLQKVSFLKSANAVVALFKIKNLVLIEDVGLTVVLDTVNDPGNLGTIIRLCDWFGVQQIICSEDTVDCYNPKVIQASMASFSRVSVVYKNITEYLKATTKTVFAATMDGENVYKTVLPKDAVLVLGNEANGISDSVLRYVDKHITIPRFGKLQQTESLNVATATAILLNEFRRNI